MEVGQYRQNHSVGQRGCNYWVSPLISDESCPHQVPPPYPLLIFSPDFSLYCSHFFINITKQNCSLFWTHSFALFHLFTVDFFLFLAPAGIKGCHFRKRCLLESLFRGKVNSVLGYEPGEMVIDRVHPKTKTTTLNIL